MKHLIGLRQGIIEAYGRRQRLRFWLSMLVFLAFGPVQFVLGQTATPTFHSVGLAWIQSGGTAECILDYRVLGSTTWLRGHSLWYDTRDGEYRGSLVNLVPATTYEIRLTAGSQTRTINSTTWDENVPIGQTINVGTQSTTLIASLSGSAAAYTLYTGGNIDVNNTRQHCIEIPDGAHHIIIDNFILTDAQSHGIKIKNGANNIVIQNCDISNFGESGFNNGTDAGVGTEDDGPVSKIVIQRNKIHDPRGGALSWRNGHPAGPIGIQMKDSDGNNVIRYNDIYSSSIDHYFRDGMRGGTNFSFEGFPGPNTDIYSNYISNVWDDGIEAEGGGENVRIWGNFIDNCYVMFGIAPVSKGPMYIFRNITGKSRKYHDTENSDAYDRGTVFKAGSDDPPYRDGRVYIYHNTVLQPPPAAGKTVPLGSIAGLNSTGGSVYQHVTRNNIMRLHDEFKTAFQDRTNSCTNDWDYDLYLGQLENECSTRNHQQHGQMGSPTFVNQNFDDGEFALLPSSRGYDDGVLIPGFNSGAPDCGAFEAGSPPMEFGIDAYEDSTGGGGGSNVVTLFTENFETTTVPGGPWISGDLNGSSGSDYWGDQTAASGARVNGGLRSAYCSDYGGLSGQIYDHNMNSYMTHNTGVSVSGYTNITVSFWIWYKTSGTNDYVKFEYLNGAVWTELARYSGTGSDSQTWTQLSLLIPSPGSLLKFRWVFYSNGSSRSEGAYIDDITVWGLESANRGFSMGNTETLLEVTPEVPVEIELEQNFPNPFNPTTNLRFTLPSDSYVTLKVYDVLGREVSRPVDDFLKRGSHSVLFSGKDLASGVYIYTLEAGALRLTKRMVLLK